MRRLLDQLVVGISYNELLDKDIDKIMKNEREFFIKKGFSVKENFMPNPDRSVSKRYVFSKDNIIINVTKRGIDVDVMAVEKYDGFESYKEYIAHIAEKIQKKCDDSTDIFRIGVRKINRIIIKDIEKAHDYFNSDLVNYASVNALLGENGGAVVEGGNHLSIANEKHKVNLITDTQIGNVKEVSDGVERTFNAYMLALDIDVYCDKSNKGFKNIGNKLSELNDVASNIYLNCLTSEFKTKLETETDFNDGNIVGGIK